MTRRKYCYCDLKTEAFAIAVLHLVGAALSAVSAVVTLCTGGYETSPETKLEKDPNKDVDKDKNEYSGLEAAFALIGSLMITVIYVLLLQGVLKQNKRFILPWLIIQGIIAGLIVVTAIIVLFVSPLYTLLLLIVSMPSFYCWHAIWSFYNTLDIPELKPQVALYPEFQPDDIPQHPGVVAYTPGLSAYNQIASQPQNV